MTMTRRDFIRDSAVAAATVAAGVNLPAHSTNLITDSKRQEVEMGQSTLPVLRHWLWRQRGR